MVSFRHPHCLAIRFGRDLPISVANGLTERLEAWLADETRTMGLVRLTLGPGDSFFAMDNQGFCWHELPPDLENILQGSLSYDGFNTFPRVVALGIEGAFVLVDSTGTLYWDLQERYSTLNSFFAVFKELEGEDRSPIAVSYMIFMQATF